MRDKGEKSSSTRWIFDHLLEQLMPSQQLRETLLRTSTHMLQFMHILDESYADFFADLEPAIFGSMASHSSITEFVEVQEAFTSCSAFRLVWHSRIKDIMHGTFPLIDSKDEPCNIPAHLYVAVFGTRSSIMRGFEALCSPYRFQPDNRMYEGIDLLRPVGLSSISV